VRNRNAEKHVGALVTLTVVLFVISPLRARAQVSGATLTGTVSDSSGAVIPNVRILIKNEGTSEVRTVTVDSAGFYSAPNLLPGQYDVTVTAPGFATSVQKGVILTVGAQQLLNVKMLVGQVTQTIEVQDLAPSVDLATSTVGGFVGQEAVAQLPLNGRDWTSLATLQPGVDAVGSIQANTGGPDRARRGYGVQMTISGTRPTQNNYRIDGISVNDYTNGGPGSVEGSTLGVDAVQEFSVLTSNYSAEYGRTSGGVVNALTKSGNNSYHGDVYEYLRNSALDARNFFDPSQIPAFRRNQFGAALGGPIVKDRTFFFADYEGLRENQGITSQAIVPSAAVRQGVLCSIPQPDPAVARRTRFPGLSTPIPRPELISQSCLTSVCGACRMRVLSATEIRALIRLRHRILRPKISARRDWTTSFPIRTACSEATSMTLPRLPSLTRRTTCSLETQPGGPTLRSKKPTSSILS